VEYGILVMVNKYSKVANVSNVIIKFLYDSTFQLLNK